jgi:hypothetical protein
LNVVVQITRSVGIEVHCELLSAADLVDELAVAASEIEHGIAGAHIPYEPVGDEH